MQLELLEDRLPPGDLGLSAWLLLSELPPAASAPLPSFAAEQTPTWTDLALNTPRTTELSLAAEPEIIRPPAAITPTASDVRADTAAPDLFAALPEAAFVPANTTPVRALGRPVDRGAELTQAAGSAASFLNQAARGTLPQPGGGIFTPETADSGDALLTYAGSAASGGSPGGGSTTSGPGGTYWIGPNTRANDRVTPCTIPVGFPPQPEIARTQSETSSTYSNGVVVVAYNDARGFCNPSHPGYQVIGWAYSLDFGFTFIDGGPLPGGSGLRGDPWLTTGPDGTIYLGSLWNGYDGLAVLRGTPHAGGVTWSFPTLVPFGFGPYDKEALTVDPVTGTVYLTYTQLAFPQSIQMFRSTDGGASFQGPSTVRPPSFPGPQGSFPAVGIYGEVYVAYNLGWPNNTGIGFALSFDAGESFFDLGQVAPITNFLIPGHNRNNHTDFPQMAIDWSSGQYANSIYVVYSTANPGTGGDAVLIHSSDFGFTWSDPVKINDDSTTGIQFFPTVSVDSNGYVNVFFYDRRENPGTTLTHLYFAQSRDGGNTFLPNQRISEVPSNWNCCPDMFPNFGDYINSFSLGPLSGVTWADGRDVDPDAYFNWVYTVD